MEQPASPNQQHVKRQKLSHSPVVPTCVDQASKELLMRRFKDLQPTLHDNAVEESFSSFIDTVGFQRADEYLDGLNKLFLDLPQDLEPCIRDYKWNCFITRSFQFHKLAKSCGFKGNQDLMQRALRLAFLRNHPDHYIQNQKIKDEAMIQALEAETQERGEQLLNEARSKFPPSPPENSPEHLKVLCRFNELHATLKKRSMDQAVESFEKFVEQSGLQLANTYLNRLQKLFEALPNDLPLPLRDSVWNEFICRDVKFEHVIKTFSLDNQNDLQAQAIWLAFLRNHPEIYQDKVTYYLQSIISALDAESEKEGLKFLIPVTCPSVSNDIIQEGHSMDFLREDTIIPPILKQLDDNTRNWDWKQYNAPYTSLIGPSMIGKSGLLTRFSEYVCVVYISLCSPLSTLSWPPRSRLASLMLPTDPSELVTHYSRLLASILKVVARFFNEQDVTESQEDRLKKWENYSLLQRDTSDTAPEGFQYDVIQEFNHHINEPLGDALVTAANESWASTNFINKDSSLKVLLAIDEAQSLLQIPPGAGDLSLFSAFCESLAKIPSHKGIFALLTNIFTPPVANFKPVAKFDPSVTTELKGGDKLYDPIYELATFDIMVDDDDPPETWKDLVLFERLVKYGHPMFGTYFYNSHHLYHQPIHVSVKAILDLAYYTLLGKKNNYSTTLTKSKAFALLGSTIQPRSTGEIDLNSELIAYHGAHCDYISPTRDIIISNYPSNYTFASLANQVLSNERNLIYCITTLTANRVHGIDASGGAVELASRIILLCAMQVAMANTTQPGRLTYGKPVQLVEFLKALTGLDEEKLNLGTISKENRSKLLKNGMVFWNHFSHITYSPTSQDLLNFLYRGMAAQCMPNEAGMDQIFTIYLRQNSDSLVEKKYVSFCGVQARNKKIDIGVEDVVKNNMWANTSSGAKIRLDNPYLMLYMNLESNENSISTLPTMYVSRPPRKLEADPQNAQRASLVFNGLNAFPCLTQGVIAALRGLIDSEQDFLTLTQSPSRTEYTRIANPCLYKE